MGPAREDFPHLRLSDEKKQKQVIERLSCLVLDPASQRHVREVFLEELQLGLAAQPERPSSLQMENTFLPELPDGTESGDYMALDLGGTNFRVLLVRMKDGKVIDEIVDYYDLPEVIRLGPGDQLFDFLAKCIGDFKKKRNLMGRKIQLGFTFSFPMTQNGLNVGILVSWTKSFNCPGVVGEDAVRLLNEALHRLGEEDINVTAVLNDTTGTLVQGAYLDKNCAIGMILGTGSNACYIERVDRMEKFEGKSTEKEMVVDTEWGAFGDNGTLDFIKTQWDRSVDNSSLLVNSFTFEKYFAGKYLGDLVREVLFTLAQEGLFCGGSLGRLNIHGTLTTTEVSNIEEETFNCQQGLTKGLLENLGLPVSQDDVHIAQYVAGIVSYRGALLISILTAAILERIEKPHSSIAIDGSLFEFHPRFRPLMNYLIKTFAPTRPFDLVLARDGSGKGAALVAAIADRINMRKVAEK